MDWGSVIGALIGAGSSAINSSQQQGAQGGYDVVTPPWHNEQGMMSLANNQAGSNYLQSQLAALQAGQLPAGMQAYLDAIQKYKMLELQKAMYGNAGKRGGSIMDNTMAVGATTGVGPKAANAGARTAMMDYSDRQKQVSDFINQAGYNTMSSLNQSVPQALMARTYPQQPQIMPVNIPGGQGLDMSALGKIDWSKLFKPTTTDTQTTVDPTFEFETPRVSGALEQYGS